jgi:hypothetical protein
LWPLPTHESHTLYQLNLHYVRKLSCKSDLFWLSCSQRENFSMTSPNICLLWLSPLGREPGSSFGKLLILFNQGWFVPSFIEIGLLVLEKKTFSIQIWFYLSRPLPTHRDYALIELESSFCQNFHVNMSSSGSVVLEKKIFQWPHPIFMIVFPLKKTWPFIWINLNYRYPWLICTKFDWIWPAGYRKGDF